MLEWNDYVYKYYWKNHWNILGLNEYLASAFDTLPAKK